MTLASMPGIIRRAARRWVPPPKLTLSEWARRYYYLSAESAAEPGRFRPFPYQVGFLDAVTDPSVTQVSVMKSARCGYTKCLNAVVGYYMHQAPCPIMVVNPTVENSRDYSREELSPMIRDCPALKKIVVDMDDTGSRGKSTNTILAKRFPGGVITLVGGNSPAGLRAKSRKVILIDEADALALSAGSEGDVIRLAIRRSEFYADRKILIGSSPGRPTGISRIEELFLSGDQRRYHVPCPECGHLDYFVFRKQNNGRGHWMRWDKDRPETAHFVCSKNGCTISHDQKRDIVGRGKWIAGAKFSGHASFHVWAAYSFSPNATWGQIATEFVEASKGGPLQLQTFVNTVLGETWTEKGDSPPYEELMARRESYRLGEIPIKPDLVTAGVDVQRNRLVYEVVAWRRDYQSWGIDYGVLIGDPSSPEVWKELDAVLRKTYPGPDGLQYKVGVMAVDSGDQAQTVYNWCRQYSMQRVIAVHGSPHARVLIGQPSAVDITRSGKTLKHGYKMFSVNPNIGKAELYGWLNVKPPLSREDPSPPGWCHFSDAHDERFFSELTGEHLVRVQKKTGHVAVEWRVLPGRENHFLDCRVYARCAAAFAGLDRFAAAEKQKAARVDNADSATVPVKQSPLRRKPARKGFWK